MSDTEATPEQLRQEVEQEIDDLEDTATTEERARMAERDATGVDEPG